MADDTKATVLFQIGVDSKAATAAWTEATQTMVKGMESVGTSQEAVAKLTKTTSEVLEKARKDGQSLTGSATQQAAERVKAVEKECDQVKAIYEKTASALKKRLDDEAAAERKATESRKAALLRQLDEASTAAEKRKEIESKLQQYLLALEARTASGKTETRAGAKTRAGLEAEIARLRELETLNGQSAERRVQIETQYSARIQQIDQSLSAGQLKIEAQKNAALTEAATRRTQAVEAIEKSAKGLGPLKTALDPVLTGFREGTLSVNDFTAAAGNLVKFAGPGGALIGGLVAAGGLMKDFADDSANAALAQKAVQQATGAGNETVGALISNFRSFGDTAEQAATDVSGILGQLSQNATDALDGNTEALERFQKAGVKDFSSVDAVIKQFIDSVRTGSKEMDAVTARGQLAGEQGIFQISRITESMDVLIQKARNAGGIFSDQDIRQAESYREATTTLSAAWDGFATRAGNKIVPVLSVLVDWISAATTGQYALSDVTQRVTALQELQARAIEANAKALEKQVQQYKSYFEFQEIQIKGIQGNFQQLEKQIQLSVKQGAVSEIEAAVKIRDSYSANAAQIIAIKKDEQLRIRAMLDDTFQKYYGTEKSKLDVIGEIDRQIAEIEMGRIERQLTVEKAAADQRSRTLRETTTNLDLALKERQGQIEEQERQGTISHVEAESRKYAATKNRIDAEILLLQGQLQQENVGADEKQRLTERLSDLRRQSASADLDHNRARIAAEVADEEKKVTTLRALSDQLRTKADAEADLKKKQLQELGYTEIEIAQQVARINAAALEGEIRNLDAVIRSKRAANASEAELLQLETERLRLVAQLENAQLVASGRIVEGYNAQRAAIDGANKAVVDYINTYTSQANLGIPGADKAPADAERIKKAMADAAAAAGAIYSQLAGIVGQATEYAKSVTAANVGEAMAWIDKLQDRINRFGEGDGQLGGLIKYANLQNEQAIKLVQDAIDKALRDEAQRRLEEQRRAQDEARAAYESYTDEKTRIDESYSETLRKIEKSRRESERNYERDRLTIATRTKTELEKLEAELSKRITDEAEKTAFERRRIAIETTQALKDIEYGAQRDLLSRRAGFIVEESNLKRQLAEAQAKAKGGDAGAVEEAKSIQAELSALAEKKRIEEKRRNDIERAEASGKSKEEIELEVKTINEKADLELEYQEQRLALIRNGDTAALRELETNFRNQLRFADDYYKSQLQYLKDKNQLEEDERASAKAKEDAEWQKRRDDILSRQQTELADLKTKYDNEKSERDKALKQAERDHDASLSALETRTAEAFSKMSALAQKYFNDLKAGIASIGSIPAPGGGGQPGSAGTDDKPGGGGGSSIRTNDDAGGKKSSGSSPGGGNKGNSQRQPPPSPPPPKPTPPPSKPTPPPAPSGGGAITAEDLVSGKGVPVFYYEDDRSLSKSDKALRKEFNDVYKVAASNLLNGLPIKGQYDRLREIAKSAQDANLSELMFRSISILLDVAARTKGSGYTNQGTGFGFEEGPSDTPDGGQKIIQDHSKPNGGEPPPGPELTATGQRIDDRPGGPTATGTDTKPTPDKPGGKPAPKPYDNATEYQTIPGPAQPILAHLSNKEIDQAEAERQWKALIAQNDALGRYDKVVMARIKELGSRLTPTGGGAGDIVRPASALSAQAVQLATAGGGSGNPNALRTAAQQSIARSVPDGPGAGASGVIPKRAAEAVKQAGGKGGDVNMIIEALPDYDETERRVLKKLKEAHEALYGRR